MKDEIFKQDAKTIVDSFFDQKLFVDKITRDDMNGIQEFIEYLLQSRYESYIRCKALSDKIKLLGIANETP